jgi:hypothetical protein
MEDKIKSVSEFIESIKLKFSNLKNEDDYLNLWFRAERADVNTPLVPNLYRKYASFNVEINFTEAKLIERNSMALFRRDAIMYFNNNGISSNAWNYYFIMQHYGVPTRLLDWTQSALVSLFFAVYKSNNDDSRIWALNPHRLNTFSTSKLLKSGTGLTPIYFPQKDDKEVLFSETNNLNFDELHRIYLDMDFNQNYPQMNNTFNPLAIQPYLFDERMRSQQSCFTIFGNELKFPLKLNLDKDIVDFVIIDGDSKRNIKSELSWLGISLTSIYPGLESMSYRIKELYNL